MTLRGRLPAFSFTPLASLRTAVADRPARSERNSQASERKPHSTYTHTHSHSHTHTLTHTLQKAGCVARSGLTYLSHIHESHPPTHGRKHASQPRNRDQSAGSSSARKERQSGERAGGHSGGEKPTPLPGRGGRGTAAPVALQALRTGKRALLHRKTCERERN